MVSGEGGREIEVGEVGEGRYERWEKGGEGELLAGVHGVVCGG